MGCGEGNQSEKNKNNANSEEGNSIVTIDESDYEKMDADTIWADATEDLITVNAGIAEDIMIEAQKQLAPENILRIEGVASISWKGVSGCCSQSRLDDQAKKAIEQWVGQQFLANRPYQYYRSGIIGQVSKAKCSLSKDWRNVRKCKGSWKQPYFIEFIKQ